MTMKKKFLLFSIITLVLCGTVFGMYWKFIRQGEYMVFVESFDHGVMTVDNQNTVGTDEKYRVVCKKGETITININPERTDTTYYNLKKLVVNGVDVTKQVNMLQYKTEVNQKLTILAYFKKGKRPEGYKAQASAIDIEKPDIITPAEDPYIGSYACYDIKDPSIIYDEDSGYYYCFGSDNVVVKSTDLVNWGGRTTYFEHPENAQNNAIMNFSAFDCVSQWAKTHGYGEDETYSDRNQDRTPLAPDIVKIDGTYYLYFSLSKTQDANESAIFCVKTDDLQKAIEEKKWEEVGLVISSCGRHAGKNTDGDQSSAHYDAANAVHPNVISTESGLFMTYGASYGRGNVKGAIYLVELSRKTGLLKQASMYNSQGETISNLHGNERFNTGVIIANPGRIPALSKKDGSLVSGSEIFYDKDSKYFYLLVTYGTEDTNYNIRVARSKNIEGPYLDYSGNSMSDFTVKANDNQYTKGTLLIGGYTFDSSSAGGVVYSNIGKASVGSPSVITTKSGKLVLASQAQLYYKSSNGITTGPVYEEGVTANAEPSLEIRELMWTKDNWPMAAAEVYSGSFADKSLKASDLYGNWDVIVFDTDGDSDDYKAVERSRSSIVSLYKQATITQSDISKKRDLNTQGTLTKSSGFYSVTIDGVEYKVYPFAMWDWELNEGSVFFSGIGSDGSTIWGKKNLSAATGLYTDTFYYIFDMCDEETKTKYNKKMQKISSNPSQYDIDVMTAEMLETVIKNLDSKK